MDRKEAIEIVRKNYPHAGFSGSEFETALRELVPELKESEDERIRKEIIDWMKGGTTYDWQENKEKWIAYLEKQKEQKPAEWSEEDRKMLDAIIKRYSFPIETDFSVFVGEDKLKDMREELGWLKSLRPQLKYEWSEEDEEMLDAMVDIVANSLYEPLCPRDKMLCWLKSLRPSLIGSPARSR